MSNKNVNWSDVPVFLAVAHEGSSLKAARALGMPQPTVSRRIEALEHALDLTLFTRTTRGFRLTSEGRALLGKAEDFAAAGDAFFSAARGVVARLDRVIRIAATEAMFNADFAAMLEEYVADHPGIRFEFVPSDHYVDMVGGEADVAIRLAPEIKEPTLVARKLGLAHIDLYASPSYSASHGLPTQETDLAAHRIVVFDGPNTPRRVNDWIFDRVGKDQIHMRCADLKSVETAVRMGVGVGPLPVGLLGTSAGLQRTGLIPASVASTVWLVTNPEAHQREEVRAFNAYLGPRFAGYLKRVAQ